MQQQTQTIKQNSLKSLKMQELLVNENRNWNLMDQEKEKLIIEKETHIDELKSELVEIQRESANANIEVAQLKNKIEDLQGSKAVAKDDEKSKSSL